MRTIANCLAEIGVSIEMLTACHDLHEEWAVLKKSYFKAALATHPDKGGDTAKFRKVQASFESLRALFDSGAVTSYATSASKSIDNAAPSHASVPSWDFYANAAEEPVPMYRVEPAKSGRSKCSAKGKAKTCGADELIPVGHLRVGSLDADTGSYGRWVRLECWRVPSKVWLGLADPDKCADATLFTAALLSMSSVLLSGVGELSEEHASAFTDHCMRKSAWAALVKRKGMPPPAQAAAASAAPAGAPTSSGAPASKALAEASASASSALVAGLPGEKQRFVIPLPGKDAPANTLAGKTVVITGIFPEVGGGAGLGASTHTHTHTHDAHAARQHPQMVTRAAPFALGTDLGKARVKAMVEAFGGKVTSSVSGPMLGWNPMRPNKPSMLFNAQLTKLECDPHASQAARMCSSSARSPAGPRSARHGQSAAPSCRSTTCAKGSWSATSPPSPTVKRRWPSRASRRGTAATASDTPSRRRRRRQRPQPHPPHASPSSRQPRWPQRPSWRTRPRRSRPPPARRRRPRRGQP